MLLLPDLKLTAWDANCLDGRSWRNQCSESSVFFVRFSFSYAVVNSCRFLSICVSLWSRNYSLLSPLCSMFSQIRYCAERCITEQVTHNLHPRICLWSHDALQQESWYDYWLTYTLFNTKMNTKRRPVHMLGKKKPKQDYFSAKQDVIFAKPVPTRFFKDQKAYSHWFFCAEQPHVSTLSLSRIIWWSHSAHNS